MPLERLFTYGTLQDPAVQRAVFGRITEGVPDTLTGFSKHSLRQGTATYPIIRADAAGGVDGCVIEVTSEELVLIDRYETDAYRRIRVTLNSGLEAWVYAE